MLDPYTVKWAADPDGGGRFTRQRDLILNHPDLSCGSLTWAWHPKKTGVTCPSDLSTCDRCDLEIYNEGVRIVFDDCEESWHYLCYCCEQVATHEEVCPEYKEKKELLP
jgi:hypothetical protein